MNLDSSKSIDVLKKHKEIEFLQKFEQFYNYFKETSEMSNLNLSSALTQNLGLHFGAILPPWLLLSILQLRRNELNPTTDSQTNSFSNNTPLCTNSYCTMTNEKQLDSIDNPLDLSKPRQLSCRSISLNQSIPLDKNASIVSLNCFSTNSCFSPIFIDEIKSQTYIDLSKLIRSQSNTNTISTVYDMNQSPILSTQPINLIKPHCLKSSRLTNKYRMLSNPYSNSILFDATLNTSTKPLRHVSQKSGLRKFQIGTSKSRKFEFSDTKQTQSSRQLDSNSSSSGKQPITRCHECKILFPSLDELNRHFIREHDQILQAELEHTKSWKSHAIEDSCFQSLKFIIARHGVVNSFGYPCPHCDYVAKWPTELQKHIMVHSKQRPHRCVICGLSYKWKWDLGRHFDKSHQTTLNPYKKNGYASTTTGSRCKQKRVNSLVKLLNSTTKCPTDHLKHQVDSNESSNPTSTHQPSVSSTVIKSESMNHYTDLSSISSHCDSINLDKFGMANWSTATYPLGSIVNRKLNR